MAKDVAAAGGSMQEQMSWEGHVPVCGQLPALPGCEPRQELVAWLVSLVLISSWCHRDGVSGEAGGRRRRMAAFLELWLGKSYQLRLFEQPLW